MSESENIYIVIGFEAVEMLLTLAEWQVRAIVLSSILSRARPILLTLKLFTNNLLHNRRFYSDFADKVHLCQW